MTRIRLVATLGTLSALIAGTTQSIASIDNPLIRSNGVPTNAQLPEVFTIAELENDKFNLDTNNLASLQQLVGHEGVANYRIQFRINGKTLEYAINSVTEPSGGGLIAYGRGDDPASYFFMGSSGESVIAMVVQDGIATRLTNCGMGSMTPESSKLIKSRAQFLDDPFCITTEHLDKQKINDDSSIHILQRGTNTVIDILFVYTTDAALYAGTQFADPNPLIASSNTLAAEANLYFSNCGLDLELNPVYSYASETSDSEVALLEMNGHMASDDSGILDEVKILREAYQADLVSGFVRDDTSTGAAGFAYRPGAFSANKLSRAFLYNRILFSHEIGHNLNVQHNEGAGSSGYNRAYVISSPGPSSIVTAGGGERDVPYYSSPNIFIDVNGVPTALGVPIGMTHEADAVSAIYNQMGTTATDMDSSQNLPDCDSDGLIDQLEIFRGTAQDCNGNGIDDACDISSGFESDCDSNGIPDSCEYTTELYVERSRSSQITSATTSKTYSFDGEPSVNSPLEITFSTSAAMNAVTSVDIYVDGVLAGTLLDSGITTTSCDTGTSDSLVYNSHDGDIQTVQFVVNDGNLNDSIACLPSAAIKLAYHTYEPSDINRNGEYDPCEPGCTPYDIAAPFGSLNYFDVSLYQSWYNSGDLLADFAEPYGEINYLDLSAFLNGYGAGCP